MANFTNKNYMSQLVEERKKEERTVVKVDPTIAVKQQLADAKANGVYINYLDLILPFNY